MHRALSPRAHAQGCLRVLSLSRVGLTLCCWPGQGSSAEHTSDCDGEGRGPENAQLHPGARVLELPDSCDSAAGERALCGTVPVQPRSAWRDLGPFSLAPSAQGRNSDCPCRQPMDLETSGEGPGCWSTGWSYVEGRPWGPLWLTSRIGTRVLSTGSSSGAQRSGWLPRPGVLVTVPMSHVLPEAAGRSGTTCVLHTCFHSSLPL